LVVALLMPPRVQQGTPDGDPVAVETWVSQSAVWPGDEIEYSVRLVVGPRVEFELGSLDGGAVPWAPFRLVDFKQLRNVRPDGSRAVTLRYRLVALDLPDQGWAPIPQLRFSYVRRPEGPTARTDLPMEEKVVDGPRIVFRSMLEGAVERATIRDGKELEDVPVSGKALLLIGFGCLAVGAYPLGRSGYPVVKRILSRRHAADARSQKRHLLEEVAALRRMPLARSEDFEELCRGLTEVLKEHLVVHYQLRFPGLTSLDADELRRAGLPDPVVERVQEIMRECEELRYRGCLPEGAEERARKALTSLDEVLAA
jgi:hypothetical protein